MNTILGIGSALVDILTRIPNGQILRELNLPKGSMTYVDAQTSVAIGEKLAHLGTHQMASGGSTANTMSGLAHLGVETGFLSKVGKDEIGHFFEKQMTDSHVKPLMLKSDTPTGRVQALVTADGERTFATCLGAAAELCADDIRPELFKGWDIFYVEGYLVSNPPMLRKAVETAKALGMTIAIDMASYNVVEENRDFLLELINDYIDIVFANEKESFALTGLEPEAALHYLAERCQIAVVKVGPKGAFIQKGKEIVTVPPMDADVVDTTGAGDMWAAGFLADWVKGEPLQKCGMMGAIVAKNIIEVVGAKMDDTRWANIHKEIGELI
jgi:sugar/nucleoside kinase (ribokinase family)